MKELAIISIVILSGVIGYMQKEKYIAEKNLLIYIKNFLLFYQLNIRVYNNDIVKIIDNYIIKHKNKSANYNNLFYKIKNIYQIDKNFLKEKIRNNLAFDLISNHLEYIGESDKPSEEERIKSTVDFIDEQIKVVEKDIKQKGDLWFKLSIAIGVAISIIIW